jgi:hypothetical protein
MSYFYRNSNFAKGSGEYKIRPYKGYRDGGRGEPCVHPLVLRQPVESCPYKSGKYLSISRDFKGL